MWLVKLKTTTYSVFMWNHHHWTRAKLNQTNLYCAHHFTLLCYSRINEINTFFVTSKTNEKKKTKKLPMSWYLRLKLRFTIFWTLLLLSSSLLLFNCCYSAFFFFFAGALENTLHVPHIYTRTYHHHFRAPYHRKLTS